MQRSVPNQPKGDARPAPGVLTGFAFACSAGAATLLGLAMVAIIFPDISMTVFGLPSSAINGLLLLQAGSGILAALGMALGVMSFRSSLGKGATLGGLLILILNGGCFLWAFSLVG